MTTKRLWPVTGVVVSLLVAGACGDGEAVDSHAGSGSGTVTIWSHTGRASENAALAEAVAGFNVSQSKIKATVKVIPESDYTKALNQANTGELPDILEFDGPILANFVHNGKLIEITPYLAKGTIDNATPAIRAQGTVEGKLYGLGMYDSGLGLYGNRRLLEAAGVAYPSGLADAWTAAKFAAALKALSARDSDRQVLDIQLASRLVPEWGTYGFAPIVWSAGALLVKDGRARGSLDSPAAVAAMREFQGWKPYVDPNADSNAFADGRVALSWTGHWMYPDYSKALGADLLVLPLPDFGAGPKTGQGSWGWAISSNTRNAKAAGAFLDYLLNDRNVTAMTQANGAPPGTRSVLERSAAYRPDGVLALFSEQLAKPCGDAKVDRGCVAVTRPLTPAYPVITVEFSRAVSAIYNDGTDPAVALSAAAGAIDDDFVANSGYPFPP